MNKHQLRVQETLQYFTQKDIGLAFRKLLDCAADTQQMSIYEKAIALTDWKEKHPAEVETLIEKATQRDSRLQGNRTPYRNGCISS